jgi:hypothetical protein
VLNPDTVDIGGFADGTRGLLRAVIGWFEARHPAEQFVGFSSTGSAARGQRHRVIA